MERCILVYDTNYVVIYIYLWSECGKIRFMETTTHIYEILVNCVNVCITKGYEKKFIFPQIIV